MPRLIKRYGNRKLYDTEESRYVTLDDIAGFVKQGEDVRVIDNDNSDDLTAITLAQIILEEERRRNGAIPASLLRTMIRQGEAALQELAERLDKSVEVIGSFGEKAGKRVEQIVGRGAESGKAFLGELRSAQQRQIEALQKRIDDAFRRSIDRLRSLPALPAVQKELGRIEKSVQRLEEQLARFRERGDVPGEPAEESEESNRDEDTDRDSDASSRRD